MTGRPDTQLFLRPGIIEIGWGHPDPALLPAADLARAAGQTLRDAGPAALAYGAEQGPGRLLEPLRAWLARRAGQPITADQLFVTGGVSQALDLLCTLLTRPGDTALVQAPVYHLALRIFADHGLELAPVESDCQGLRVDALAATLEALHAQGRRPRFLYTAPTFCNPTGISLADERRTNLVAMAARHNVLILEDDVYRELWYDSRPPTALHSLAPANVIQLGSFSKLLAPGLRLGWLMAAPELIQRCVGCGLLDSGGGVNHFTAHIVASYLEMGMLDRHIEALRAVYCARRDALLTSLARFMPEGCAWETPRGGFFAWVQLPKGFNSVALLPFAEQTGVSFVPGARFYAGGGGERYLRLAFSLLHEQDLAEGARRLGCAMRG